ncbi:hypothetical protein ciss_12090 [Carboxydothermus islandicus]|uniref:Uncharacterized protein n=1 Tax=Carboxydothermus islandicus TaxID=661089 RepID=A0A1L8D264_9THEO|nr:hypothetical protein [Carboxydothermus islandicus]GAV25276.1 hypothetical protein ciss_12090 [Carboxydothermus islandicus]
MLEAILAGFFVYGVISALLVIWEALNFRKKKNLWLVVNDLKGLSEAEKLLDFLKERIPGTVETRVIDLTGTLISSRFQVINGLPEEIQRKNYIIFF